MRIAINTLAMRDRLYGVGNYIRNLIQSLAIMDQTHEYLLFVSCANARHVAGLGRNFRYKFVPSNRLRRLAWEQMGLVSELRRENIDVFHGPMFITPLRKQCAYVTSMLDMTFFLSPERHTLMKRLYFQRMTPVIARKADAILAISESTKRDIVTLLGIDARKVTVTPLGVSTAFRPITDEGELARVRTRYRLPNSLILYVGLIEPRKNLETLVRAFESDPQLNREHHLVLAGNLGWGYEALLSKIKASPVRDRIHLPGYVADDDLPSLYCLATVFVYPSLYEGFGLPVLEAMACGRPVVSSNVSSIPEIVGDAGTLVDPADRDALVCAIREIVHNRGFASQLGLRARARSQLFTWESVARKTLAVYESIA